jgi:hypothetical protein
LTIAAGWVRHFGQSQELVLASDSRLRWAGAWDSCPKIFSLPRSDAAIAFAGDAMWAPIIAQTGNHIAAYRPSLRRETDLLETKGHALRVINATIQSGDALARPEAPDDNAACLSVATAQPNEPFDFGVSTIDRPIANTRPSAFARDTSGSFASLGRCPS